ncbi:hypothetical protein WA026_017673 [Henosepilachna vigintioctopunctata]|uniref:Uncharacterized protein n=1 Tax=Henosepilachna vigintioctopunctata TaxID=420089 RepID=A0AAW1U997_9CUCU
MMERLGPNVEKNIKSGFKGCGIYPLDREHVLNKLCDMRKRGRNEAEKPLRKRKKKVDVAPRKLDSAKPSTSAGGITCHKKNGAITAQKKHRQDSWESSDEELLNESDISYAESEDSFTSLFKSRTEHEDDDADVHLEIEGRSRGDKEEREKEKVIFARSKRDRKCRRSTASNSTRRARTAAIKRTRSENQRGKICSSELLWKIASRGSVVH